jgi:hypothetical protein
MEKEPQVREELRSRTSWQNLKSVSKISEWIGSQPAVKDLGHDAADLKEFSDALASEFWSKMPPKDEESKSSK